jgi:hypothetical protein
MDHLAMWMTMLEYKKKVEMCRSDQSCLWIQCGHVHVWGNDFNLKE